MAEPISPPEEISEYLLGQLPPAARRRFEARLEQDAELRQRVRELEEGMLALALTAPRCEAPPQAWTHIEAAINRQARRSFWPAILRLRWLANGWAMAGCLAVVFLVHAFWFHPPSATRFLSLNPGTGTKNVAWSKPAPGGAATMAGGNANRPAAAVTAQNLAAAAARADEMQQKVSRLESQLAKLSQLLKQQQANAASLKGLQLVPPGLPSAHGQTQLSPQLQQAILLAVANQMGWNQTADPGHLPPVDFVELQSPALQGADTTMAANTPGPDASLIADGAGLATNSVPMIAWDNRIFAAVDPATLPPNSGPVTVSTVDQAGNQLVVGMVPVDSNPVVININNADTSGIHQYTITVGGGTNIIGHFP